MFESIDTRLSLIIVSSFVLFSFFSRIFDLKISKAIEKTKFKDLDVFLIIFIFYLLPFLMLRDFVNYITIGVFIVFRVMIGIIFSLSCRNIKLNDENISLDIRSIKYWLSYLLGLSFGVGLYFLVNEIYSNEFLNNGGWKILYLLILSFLFTIIIFSKFILKKTITLDHKLNCEKNYLQFPISSNYFTISIPFISIIMFATSSWMPKFSNPENLYFLSYDFLYLFLTLLILIFVKPLSNLVGRRKSLTFFNLSIVLISLISSFLNHDSSYSIDFLKFFISLVTSFTICCFILQLELKKIDKIESISFLNLSTLGLFFLVPPLFYYFIFFSINYSVIYIFLGLVYFMNYIIFYFKKNG